MRNKLLPMSIYLITGSYVLFRLVALWSVPMIGDEPDDLNIIARDIPGILNFFSSPGSYALDQARLPYLISAPLVYLLEEHVLIPLRIVFLSFHLLYLFFSYKLVSLLTNNRNAAWGYVVCLVMSCYLASFSIFSITTSDNLYLLFHLLCIYYFIKGYFEHNRSHIFPHYLLLTVFIALCISSKLFGILLLVALFLFHYLNKDKDTVVQIHSVRPNRLILFGIIFLLSILVINLLPTSGTTKLSAALLISAVYLSTIIAYSLNEHRRSFSAVKVGFATFWITLVLTSFNLTLIFSPVYLNLNNVLKTFTWFDEWGSGLLVARSHYYDMFVIVVMKFGMASSVILLLVSSIGAFILFKHHRPGFRKSPYFLLILIAAIHFIVISLVKHKVSWYPLAIFPFLYLPVILLWTFAKKNSLKIVATVSILSFALILADNNMRYFHWFPYGHFDGAQYGSEYVGWNRAGLISYEILPQLTNYLTTLEDSKKVSINCQVVNVPLYNKWVANLLRQHFRSNGNRRFAITGRQFNENYTFDYFLTSPLYYPEFENKLRNNGLNKIHSFEIKGITIASIWK